MSKSNHLHTCTTVNDGNRKIGVQVSKWVLSLCGATKRLFFGKLDFEKVTTCTKLTKDVCASDTFREAVDVQRKSIFGNLDCFSKNRNSRKTGVGYRCASGQILIPRLFEKSGFQQNQRLNTHLLTCTMVTGQYLPSLRKGRGLRGPLPLSGFRGSSPVAGKTA